MPSKNISLILFPGRWFAWYSSENLFWFPAAHPFVLRGRKSQLDFLDGRYLNSTFFSGWFCEEQACATEPRTRAQVHGALRGAAVSGVYPILHCARVYGAHIKSGHHDRVNSGSREPGSIPVSALLVGFFPHYHAEKYTYGQSTQPLMWLFEHPENVAPLGTMCQRVKRQTPTTVYVLSLTPYVHFARKILHFVVYIYRV